MLKILRKFGYALLSLVLAFHVFAVFISPAAMPPVSPLLQDGYLVALPYNEALFLNHGYHFFAPDPGASTLISYSIPRPGDAPLVGRIPNLTIRPRLLYHRYFMLAENIWAFDEETQADVQKAYARHFSSLHHSNAISLDRISHEPSSILRIQAGGHLDDPETFEAETIGTFDFFHGGLPQFICGTEFLRNPVMTQGPRLLQRCSPVPYVRQCFSDAVDGWHRFWFEPADPLMLGIIRLLCGWMLFYNLLIWTLDLEAFFGDHGLQPLAAIREIYQSRLVFSFWLWTGDAYLWPIHFACMAVAAMFCLGIGTRVTSVLSFLITISYSQRVPIANFGFDQILGLLCLYLSVGPSGAAVSVDSLIRRFRLRRRGLTEQPRKFPSARVAMRLIQLHLCAIYFWAGFAKLKGPSWWTGEAMWRVLANQEYQTVDLTWMAWVPWLPFLIAHITIAWEVFFIALIWNPKLRPLMLAMGVAMHVGIGAFLGMWTFGLIMAFAYLAFSDPDVWRKRISSLTHWARRSPEKNSAGSKDSSFPSVPHVTHIDRYFMAETTTSAPSASSSHSVNGGGSLSDFSDSEASFTGSAVLKPAGRELPDGTSLADDNSLIAEAVCVIAASPDDRAALRRYFSEQGIACRAVADLGSGLEVVSRHRVSVVILNGTQFSSANMIDFVADVSDRSDLPVLVMLTPQHLSMTADLSKNSRAGWLELPASLHDIRDSMFRLKDSVQFFKSSASE